MTIGVHNNDIWRVQVNSDHPDDLALFRKKFCDFSNACKTGHVAFGSPPEITQMEFKLLANLTGDQGEVFFRLRNANIVGFFYLFNCYMFRKYDHLQADIFQNFTLLTTDPLFFT
jgi:hypothetical protein